MSASFTSVANWTKEGQDLVGANQIVLAYSERRQSLRQSAVDPLAVGDNAQDTTFWYDMQEWLEDTCTSFVDWTNPIRDDGTWFRYFDIDTWRTKAGLNASGFRRKANMGDAFSYGRIQSGDIRGLWCFEDLQKGFGALRMNAMYPQPGWDRNGETLTRRSTSTLVYTGITWAQEKTNVENYWDGLTGQTVDSSASCWSDGFYRKSGADDEWGGRLSQTCGYPHIIHAAQTIPRTLTIYLKGNMSGFSGDVVYDDNGDGVSETMTLKKTVAEGTGAIDEFGSKVGRTPANGVYPVWCNEPALDAESARGYQSYLGGLAQWNFTNA